MAEERDRGKEGEGRGSLIRGPPTHESREQGKVAKVE